MSYITTNYFAYDFMCWPDYVVWDSLVDHCLVHSCIHDMASGVSEWVLQDGLNHLPAGCQALGLDNRDDWVIFV